MNEEDAAPLLSYLLASNSKATLKGRYYLSVVGESTRSKKKIVWSILTGILLRKTMLSQGIPANAAPNSTIIAMHIKK